ncbi:MAG: hypothetical protein DRG40_02335 [Deltaproteobacteria bacterium]|nr:MAG: hypothetical protein DRG40_02335 [Deltaproteobacteria bacterium]
MSRGTLQSLGYIYGRGRSSRRIAFTQTEIYLKMRTKKRIFIKIERKSLNVKKAERRIESEKLFRGLLANRIF